MPRALALALVALLVACGDSDSGGTQAGGSSPETSVDHDSDGDDPGDGIAVRVRGSLEEAGDGFQLCPGGVGPCWSVVGWPVAASSVDAETGPVTAEGTVQGTDIALESVTPIDHNEDGFPDPCEGEDLGRFARDEMDAIEAAVPSVAGTWLTSDQETLVLVVVDDAQGTRERLAAAGHTGVCVADMGFEYTLAELSSAQAAMGDRWQTWADQGWHLTGSGIDVRINRVTATFDSIDQRLKAELAESDWGSMIEMEAVIEVLDGHQVDDLDQPGAPDQITITTQPRTAGGMGALGTFLMRYDREAECIWFEGPEGSRVKPIWPYGTTARRDPMVVFDGRGRPLAAIGQEIETGGGFGQVLPGSDDPTDCGAAEVWVIAPGSVGQ